MKVLYFDCSSGISGNMTLGALSELIDDPHYLVNELKKLNVDGYHIHISKEKKNGITGTYVDVHLEHEHHHEHEHEHLHHEHAHHHHHEHRNLFDVNKIIDESEIDEKEAEKTAKKMMKGNFDLEDFLNQLNQIKKLGPLENLLKLLPGAKKMGLNNVNIDPKIMKRTEAIVLSMTPEERRDPSILKASRKKRIADGSGTMVTDVNKLLNQFEEMKKMMKMMGDGNFKMPF